MSQRVAEEYLSSLDTLQTNAKVEINALTMAAEDNSEFAVDIAACIENQLKRVPKNRKLPLLYLIDSICKNFPNSKYVELFTQNIVSNFCNVFQSSDEKVRRSLHKLRLTWSETKTFPKRKLNAIDERVHAMDPKWPILDQPIASVNNNEDIDHRRNVKKLKTQLIHHESEQQQMQHLLQQQQQRQQQQQQQQQAQLLLQQPQLVQQSLLQNHQQQQHQEQQQYQEQHQQHLHLHQQQPQPQPQPQPQLQLQPQPQPQPQPQLQPQPQPQQQPQPQLRLQPQPQPLAQPQQQQLQQPLEITILESLYGGKQCSNCSLRFDGKEIYANHLDWHFRQNKSDRYPRRQWYYPLDLWIQFRDVNDEVQHQENEEITSTPNYDDIEIPTATASKEDSLNICPVCQESFEKFWFEEEEEWRLRKAILHEERVYHPSCLEDLLARKK